MLIKPELKNSHFEGAKTLYDKRQCGLTCMTHKNLMSKSVVFLQRDIAWSLRWKQPILAVGLSGPSADSRLPGHPHHAHLRSWSKAPST